MGYGEEKEDASNRKLAKAGDPDSLDQDLGRIAPSCRTRYLWWRLEHVKAHRRKKDKNEMSNFEKFVTEGNEKTDELATARAMFDEGFVAEVRASTIQQEREGVYATAVSFHCLEEDAQKRAWTNVETNSGSRRRQTIGKLKDKEGESGEKSIRGFGKSLRCEVSW